MSLRYERVLFHDCMSLRYERALFHDCMSLRYERALFLASASEVSSEIAWDDKCLALYFANALHFTAP